MAEGSQTELTFVDEDARDKAMDELDESPENMEKLLEIRNAPIKLLEEAEETPANLEDVSHETPEKVEETTTTSEIAEESQSFTINKEDLPLNYDTPGKAFKSLQEKEALIERQAEKIRSLSEERPPDVKPPEEKPEVKAPVEAGESKLAEINQLRQEIAKSDDAFDEKTIEKNRMLNDLIVEEMLRMNTVIGNQAETIQANEQSSQEYQKSFKDSIQTKKNETALEKEYAQIDELGIDEYKMSKTSKEVEEDYLAWGNNVAIQYYGRKPQNNEEFHRAINALLNNSPDLIQKCGLAQIPVAPGEDVDKYMQVCSLMDYRDGWREKPDGTRFRVTKYDPYTKADIPDTFPSLKAAIENKRVESGYYKQKEADAFSKGGKEVLAAVGKRDNSELDNTQSGQSPDTLSQEELNRKLDEFDEVKALKLYRQGDKSMLDDQNAVRAKVGMSPIDPTDF